MEEEEFQPQFPGISLSTKTRSTYADSRGNLFLAKKQQQESLTVSIDTICTAPELGQAGTYASSVEGLEYWGSSSASGPFIETDLSGYKGSISVLSYTERTSGNNIYFPTTPPSSGSSSNLWVGREVSSFGDNMQSGAGGFLFTDYDPVTCAPPSSGTVSLAIQNNIYGDFVNGSGNNQTNAGGTRQNKIEIDYDAGTWSLVDAVPSVLLSGSLDENGSFTFPVLFTSEYTATLYDPTTFPRLEYSYTDKITIGDEVYTFPTRSVNSINNNISVGEIDKGTRWEWKITTEGFSSGPTVLATFKNQIPSSWQLLVRDIDCDILPIPDYCLLGYDPGDPPLACKSASCNTFVDYAASNPSASDVLISTTGVGDTSTTYEFFPYAGGGLHYLQGRDGSILKDSSGRNAVSWDARSETFNRPYASVNNSFYPIIDKLSCDGNYVFRRAAFPQSGQDFTTEECWSNHPHSQPYSSPTYDLTPGIKQRVFRRFLGYRINSNPGYIRFDAVNKSTAQVNTVLGTQASTATITLTSKVFVYPDGEIWYGGTRNVGTYAGKWKETPDPGVNVGLGPIDVMHTWQESSMGIVDDPNDAGSKRFSSASGSVDWVFWNNDTGEKVKFTHNISGGGVILYGEDGYYWTTAQSSLTDRIPYGNTIFNSNMSTVCTALGVTSHADLDLLNEDLVTRLRQSTTSANYAAPPECSSIPGSLASSNQTVTQGDVFNYTVTASGFTSFTIVNSFGFSGNAYIAPGCGEELAFSASALPASLSIDPRTGTIYGTATAATGTYPITVTAVACGVSISTTFDLIIQA